MRKKVSEKIRKSMMSTFSVAVLLLSLITGNVCLAANVENASFFEKYGSSKQEETEESQETQGAEQETPEAAESEQGISDMVEPEQGTLEGSESEPVTEQETAELAELEQEQETAELAEPAQEQEDEYAWPDADEIPGTYRAVVDGFVDEVGNTAGNLLEFVYDCVGVEGLNLALHLEAAEAAGTLVTALSGQDFKWAKSLDLGVRTDLENVRASVDLNEVKLGEITGNVNWTWQNWQVGVPEYTTARLAGRISNLSYSLAEARRTIQDIPRYFPSGELVKEMARQYADIFLDHSSTVSFDKEILTVNGISEDALRIEAIYGPSEICNSLEDVCDRIATDQKLYEILGNGIDWIDRLRQDTMAPGRIRRLAGLQQWALERKKHFEELEPEPEDVTVSHEIWKDPAGRTLGTRLSYRPYAEAGMRELFSFYALPAEGGSKEVSASIYAFSYYYDQETGMIYDRYITINGMLEQEDRQYSGKLAVAQVYGPTRIPLGSVTLEQAGINADGRLEGGVLIRLSQELVSELLQSVSGSGTKTLLTSILSTYGARIAGGLHETGAQLRVEIVNGQNAPMLSARLQIREETEMEAVSFEEGPVYNVSAGGTSLQSIADAILQRSDVSKLILTLLEAGIPDRYVRMFLGTAE